MGTVFVLALTGVDCDGAACVLGVFLMSHCLQ